MLSLTREEALRLHRQMWSDMKEALGDCPSFTDRYYFKEGWCLEHTPECIPENNCYLCQYISEVGDSCSSCPIDWGAGPHGCNCVGSRVDYRYSPISEILALPERKEAP